MKQTHNGEGDNVAGGKITYVTNESWIKNILSKNIYFIMLGFSLFTVIAIFLLGNKFLIQPIKKSLLENALVIKDLENFETLNFTDNTESIEIRYPDIFHTPFIVSYDSLNTNLNVRLSRNVSLAQAYVRVFVSKESWRKINNKQWEHMKNSFLKYSEKLPSKFKREKATADFFSKKLTQKIQDKKIILEYKCTYHLPFYLKWFVADELLEFTDYYLKVTYEFKDGLVLESYTYIPFKLHLKHKEIKNKEVIEIKFNYKKIIADLNSPKIKLTELENKIVSQKNTEGIKNKLASYMVKLENKYEENPLSFKLPIILANGYYQIGEYDKSEVWIDLLLKNYPQSKKYLAMKDDITKKLDDDM